ncbi:MAG: 50S ribosomal protein L23 [Lentisphaeria bacterium]|jgi:large subunit ribosomal protein L23
MKDPYQIVKSVLITEKSTQLSEALNKYCFKVEPAANKIEIKKAVEALFNVKVAAVNVMNREGKRKRMRSAQPGKRSDWKKAIVTLKDGKIDIL